MKQTTHQNFNKGMPVLWVLLFLLYGILGTPTPENITWVEILIGGCLTLLALPKIYDVLKNTERFWLSPPILFFTLGTSIGLIGAGIYGALLSDVIRDYISFIFLLMPFLYVKNHPKIITIGAIITGTLFSLRFLIEVNPLTLALTDLFSDPQFSYLANSPLVFFCALFCLYALFKNIINDKYAVSFFACLGAILPLIAMLVMQQRATLTLCLIFFIAGIIWVYSKNPIKGFVITIGIILLGVFYNDQIILAASIVIEKTKITGTNMRFEELKTVTYILTDSWSTILFGKGWGATLISPAVGNIPVTFTHNMLSMYWFKTGLIGLGFLIFYGQWLWVNFYSLLINRPLYACVFLFPILIGVLIYANFKSFGFGVVLLMAKLACDKKD